MPGHSQAAAPAAPVTDAASQEDPAMQAGRELSQLFLQGDTDAVWARMSPQMQEALGSAAALAQFRAQVAGNLGEEEAILDESTETAPGAHVYLRTSRWSRRSEEHTSELQSLMRNSYAVICLKKTKHPK